MQTPVGINPIVHKLNPQNLGTLEPRLTPPAANPPQQPGDDSLDEQCLQPGEAQSHQPGHDQGEACHPHQFCQEIIDELCLLPVDWSRDVKHHPLPGQVDADLHHHAEQKNNLQIIQPGTITPAVARLVQSPVGYPLIVQNINTLNLGPTEAHTNTDEELPTALPPSQPTQEFPPTLPPLPPTQETRSTFIGAGPANSRPEPNAVPPYPSNPPNPASQPGELPPTLPPKPPMPPQAPTKEFGCTYIGPDPTNRKPEPTSSPPNPPTPTPDSHTAPKNSTKPNRTISPRPVLSSAKPTPPHPIPNKQSSAKPTFCTTKKQTLHSNAFPQPTQANSQRYRQDLTRTPQKKRKLEEAEEQPIKPKFKTFKTFHRIDGCLKLINTVDLGLKVSSRKPGSRNSNSNAPKPRTILEIDDTIYNFPNTLTPRRKFLASKITKKPENLPNYRDALRKTGKLPNVEIVRKEPEKEEKPKKEEEEEPRGNLLPKPKGKENSEMEMPPEKKSKTKLLVEHFLNIENSSKPVNSEFKISGGRSGEPMRKLGASPSNPIG